MPTSRTRLVSDVGRESVMNVAMKSVACCLVVLIVCVATDSLAPAGAAERPNILFVVADDMGFSDPGFCGGEIQTPTLDRLAANGLRLTQAFNCARCCPTRAALLTGKYAHEVGLARNGASLSLAAPTIAELLWAGGYRTAMVGKWHLSAARPLAGDEFNSRRHLAWLNHQAAGPDLFADRATYPAARGFERHYGIIWGVVDFFDPFSLVDGFEPVREVPKDFYLTDALSDRAVEYVRDLAGDDKPFFLYLAYTAPHWPLHARREDIAKYEGVYDDGPAALRRRRYQRQVELGVIDAKTHPLPPIQRGDRPAWDKLSDVDRRRDIARMMTHAAMVDRMDQGLARVIAALEAAGELDSTLIVFFSDNGASPERPGAPGYDRPSHTRDGRELLYDDRASPEQIGDEISYTGIGPAWASACNTPFRYWKKESYFGGQQTPCFVHWPDGIHAEDKDNATAKTPRASATLVHVFDFAATALDVAGVAYPKTWRDKDLAPMRGKSLVPTLRGQRRDEHDRLFFEHEGGAAVREGDWKLVRLNPRAKWELYRVAVDRTEMHDLAAERPETVARLAAAFAEWERSMAKREE